MGALKHSYSATMILLAKLKWTVNLKRLRNCLQLQPFCKRPRPDTSIIGGQSNSKTRTDKTCANKPTVTKRPRRWFRTKITLGVIATLVASALMAMWIARWTADGIARVELPKFLAAEEVLPAAWS